jgi:CDP-glucose 4,6-dehydratase
MRYLVTGHTGFKGAWLSLWLAGRGHEVHGIALDPQAASLFTLADVAGIVASDVRLDIRDARGLAQTVSDIQPEVVIHLAAQPLVRESYREPQYTVETNAIGTMHLLDATRAIDCVEAQVIVTTDKVYRNVNRREGYLEDEPLGGADPYSASKAMADILVQSWCASFDMPRTVIARAGNVIGGGDDSADRLLPDLIRSYQVGVPPRLRYPNAVRPWQHVLDCLHGYLRLVDATLTGSVPQGSAWNFGPDDSSFVTVGEVSALVGELWGSSVTPAHDPDPGFHEAGLLALDSSKARSTLGWHDVLAYRDAVAWTVGWYRGVGEGTWDARSATLRQIAAFDAAAAGGVVQGTGLDA